MDFNNLKEMVPTKVQVRYVETDQMGLVYHANYLIYFDIARTDWIEQIWKPYSELEDAGHFMVVVDAQLKFKTPAKFDDVLTIVVTPVKWNKVRLSLEYKIVCDGDSPYTVCTGSTSHCLVDRNGMVQRMPKEFFDILSG